VAGIYVHIPFCLKKCAYCDFVSFPAPERGEEYVHALLREIELWAGAGLRRRYDTLFIGGGTPSILDEKYIASIMGRLNACLDLSIEEATIECNPGTLSLRKLEAYREAGFDRLSIGAQSFSAALLGGIGRIHGPEQIYEAVKAARSAGFENINLDLMYGLPGQTAEDYMYSIRAAAELGAAHISAYSLILEEGTPLFYRVAAGEVKLPDDDETYHMHRSGMALLEGLGYRRYEISNYARPGRQCRHNLNYWNCGEYLGLGVNASSAMEREGWRRWRNHDALAGYIQAAEEGRLPIVEEEIISEEEQMFEWMMLGLRKLEGVDRAAFKRRFGRDAARVYAAPMDRLISMGYMELDERSIRLTDRGLDMQNAALLELMG